MTTDTMVFQSRPHFLILDGLRGVVALIVVLFHFMEIIISDFSKNPLAHGFLGVDFFFCLSGFVVAYAYDIRVKQLTTWQFIKLRLIRLQPLVFIGAVLGLITFLFDPFSQLQQQYSLQKVLVFFITGIFLIPFPRMEERFYNLFSFNAPSWSLFWEYVSNLLYIIGFYKFTKSMLSICAIIFATIIVYIVYQYGNLLGGWSGETFWHGGARVAYSFTIGMIIYRKNWIIKNKLNFYVISALLLIGFLVPYNINSNWLFEPLIVLFYFPLIVSIGAGSSSTTSKITSIKLAAELSYPLYMIHYPFIWIFLSYFLAKKPETTQLWILVPTCVIGLVLIAYLVLRFIDEPIRKYLKRTCLNR